MIYLKKIVIMLSFIILSVNLYGNKGIVNVDFALLKLENKTASPLKTKRPVKFNNGESFQIYISVDAMLESYIVYQDNNGEATVLHNMRIYPRQPIFLPSKTAMYQVNFDSGTENIYIVLSQEKIESLEINIGKNSIVDEILKLKSAVSTLAENPEKPAPMGGVFRRDESFETETLSVNGILVKSIKIRH